MTLKDTNFPFRSVSTSVTPSRPRWSRRSNPFVSLSPGDKKMAPNQLFLIWCIWSKLIWVSVKILTSLFRFLQIEVPNSVSRDLWCHQNYHISCCKHWKFREKKFLNLASYFILWWRWRSLKWLKEISFYERKKENFARKEKFILWESCCFELFGDGKYGLLLIQKVDVRWNFL